MYSGSCLSLQFFLGVIGSLVYLEVYVMSAGTRSGKVLRKNTTAAKEDKMLPSASAQTCDSMWMTPQIPPMSLNRRKKVIKERDALRKQLAYLSKAPREEQSSEEDTASCSSLSSMSRSSSCSSSSSSDEKMKLKGKGKLRLSKTKNKIKKGRKHHKVTDVRKRARGPFEVIRRYKKVLKAYNRGLKLSASCAYAGVNKLTVRSTASIAELATASPAEFTKLLDKTKQAKLKDVANLCENYIKVFQETISTRDPELVTQSKLLFVVILR
ncbi:unnamed protein product [Boreogadus saida]